MPSVIANPIPQSLPRNNFSHTQFSSNTSYRPLQSHLLEICHSIFLTSYHICNRKCPAYTCTHDWLAHVVAFLTISLKNRSTSASQTLPQAPLSTITMQISSSHVSFCFQTIVECTFHAKANIPKKTKPLPITS